jgi:hypothetical protein
MNIIFLASLCLSIELDNLGFETNFQPLDQRPYNKSELIESCQTNQKESQQLHNHHELFYFVGQQLGQPYYYMWQNLLLVKTEDHVETDGIQNGQKTF